LNSTKGTQKGFYLGGVKGGWEEKFWLNLLGYGEGVWDRSKNDRKEIKKPMEI